MRGCYNNVNNQYLFLSAVSSKTAIIKILSVKYALQKGGMGINKDQFDIESLVIKEIILRICVHLHPPQIKNAVKKSFSLRPGDFVAIFLVAALPYCTANL